MAPMAAADSGPTVTKAWLPRCWPSLLYSFYDSALMPRLHAVASNIAIPGPVGSPQSKLSGVYKSQGRVQAHASHRAGRRSRGEFRRTRSVRLGKCIQGGQTKRGTKRCKTAASHSAKGSMNAQGSFSDRASHDVAAEVKAQQAFIAVPSQPRAPECRRRSQPLPGCHCCTALAPSEHLVHLLLHCPPGRLIVCSEVALQHLQPRTSSTGGWSAVETIAVQFAQSGSRIAVATDALKCQRAAMHQPAPKHTHTEAAMQCSTPSKYANLPIPHLVGLLGCQHLILVIGDLQLRREWGHNQRLETSPVSRC